MNQLTQHPPVTLEISSLSVSRGERPVIDELRLTHGSGRLLQVLGANGSGKSTLLTALAGLLPFDGAVDWRVDGVDLDETPVASQMLHLSHLNAVRSELSVMENLQFWADASPGNRAEISSALDAARLGALSEVMAGHMSKGQQRRLSLARLLVIARPIWLLDEPTSALDNQGDAWVAGLIAEHLRRGGFCIAATHRAISLPQDVGLDTLVLDEQDQQHFPDKRPGA